MKGIILAGGSGTRLHPLTITVSKQLLPIHDKPMIYYPISVLMMSGIREILIISTPNDLPNFKKLLGDGSNLGLKFSYEIQPKPEGLAQAFIIGEEFIGDSDVCLILGDNFFFGSGLVKLLRKAKETIKLERGAVIFGNYVKDPKNYGVVEFEGNDVISINEKPSNPKSNYAVVGLYFYSNDVIKIAKNVRPSNRGELEITSINQFYLDQKKLKLEHFSRGFAWSDTGTHESLTRTSEFVKVIENRTGLKIACLEEIAMKFKYVDKATVLNNIKIKKGAYFEYIKTLS
jgi:glucose-1-phosphate thymidylyltransferase